MLVRVRAGKAGHTLSFGAEQEAEGRDQVYEGKHLLAHSLLAVPLLPSLRGFLSKLRGPLPIPNRTTAHGHPLASAQSESPEDSRSR